MRWLAVAALVACGPHHADAPQHDALGDRFPLARLGDKATCDALLARAPESYARVVDPEPQLRRKIVVSDLHLGPGTSDKRFTGIEDFYAEPDWRAFLARHGAEGPTDLIIAGDFIDYWQIAVGMHALPTSTDKRQPAGPVLAADQAFSVAATKLVIAAHRDVFRALGELIAHGDHRVIILAGNHDADLLWPKVQLEIARAIAPVDPARLMFIDAQAYEHGGVHVEHGHAYDAANKFAAVHAPFGRDRDGRCRLQSSWGEIFVDAFYTETERQVPFIDNLYPESAAILWAVRDNPDPQRDLGAAVRFIDLLRVAETKELNKDAFHAVLQEAFGTPGGRDRGPESAGEVLDHVTDRLANGDPKAIGIVNALVRLSYDPDVASLWSSIITATRALPDMGAAISALRQTDPAALGRLKDELFGGSMETAAKRVLDGNPQLGIVVFGHTHTVGGALKPIGKRGFYANTGSWLSVASVAELKARGIEWDQLSLLDRSQFPPKSTAVIIGYANGVAQQPVVENAR